MRNEGMRPKPAFLGMPPVPWKTAQTKELAAALARARVLEGREKDAVYQEFGLLALRSIVNGWLKGQGLQHFALTSPLILYGSVFCDQSAVSMRFSAGLPGSKFTLLSRCDSASGAADGKHLF
jgi:hypothetical protein